MTKYEIQLRATIDADDRYEAHKDAERLVRDGFEYCPQCSWEINKVKKE